jgi:hypothetical protein
MMGRQKFQPSRLRRCGRRAYFEGATDDDRIKTNPYLREDGQPWGMDVYAFHWDDGWRAAESEYFNKDK